ncbi:MAG: M14 family metallopeptidase [Sphingobacteriales bacterium]|nr:M14 family metallopeptidase [Sphingobacteriales bacterium]
MKKNLFLAINLVSLISFGQNITTRFEQSGGKESPTYFEIIDWWKKLDAASPYVKMMEMGMSDAGYPLHLILVSADKDFNMPSLKKKNKRFILINNGIHPGEPDGIDASMLLARDIDIELMNTEASGKKFSNAAKYPVTRSHFNLPDNIVLAIIPVYNIGGCLNRSPNYRIDQNGPVEKGFRGNSQNLDLNRDFIKCDSKEARSFAEIFHLVDPDVFLDNHVSDGADYQHVMTLICTQHNKLGGILGEFMNKNFEPGLYTGMKEKGYDLIPYVNAFGDSPDNGWPEFFEGPRYGSGYAALWHTFSFVAETHMLKPYDQRVKATYDLMKCFIDFTSQNSDEIKKLRDQTKESVKSAAEFPISWSLDRSKSSRRIYKGYASGRKPSDVSGLPRLFYDRSKPYEKEISFYNYYKPSSFIQKPQAYIIPQGWWKVIDLLKANQVQMHQLKKDTAIEVEVYRIDDYKTAARQYEMHHINSDVKTSTTIQKIVFKKGDYYIPTNQVANRFLIETLEPTASDSYFAWNFFDALLGQKEGYSGYSFEDIAATYLKTNPDLMNKLETKRASDTAFTKDGRAQLNFVYQNSPFFENSYLRYPVYRLVLR